MHGRWLVRHVSPHAVLSRTTIRAESLKPLKTVNEELELPSRVIGEASRARPGCPEASVP